MHGSIEYRHAVAAIIDLLREEMNPRQCGCRAEMHLQMDANKECRLSCDFPPFSLSSSVDESASLIHRKNKNLELLIFFVFFVIELAQQYS